MEVIAEKELPMWEEYVRNPNRKNREKIILYYMELVKIVVASLWKYFYSRAYCMYMCYPDLD